MKAAFGLRACLPGRKRHQTEHVKKTGVLVDPELGFGYPAGDVKLLKGFGEVCACAWAGVLRMRMQVPWFSRGVLDPCVCSKGSVVFCWCRLCVVWCLVNLVYLSWCEVAGVEV